MTQEAKTIVDAALTLSSGERAEIASQLIRSLDGPEPSEAEQAKIDAAWREEIQRRMREIKEGRAELIPGEEVMAELRSRAGGHSHEGIQR